MKGSSEGEDLGMMGDFPGKSGDVAGRQPISLRSKIGHRQSNHCRQRHAFAGIAMVSKGEGDLKMGDDNNCLPSHRGSPLTERKDPDP